MSQILQAKDIGTPAMLEAMEANFAEEMMCFGRGTPGGEVHEDDELSWFITGRPYLNGVTRTYLARDDKAYVEAKIIETCNRFQVRGVGFNWAVGPLTRPGNLGTYLENSGFTHRHEDIGMAIDITAISEDLPPPPELVIQECQNAEMLRAWLPVEMRGFNASEDIATRYYENYINIGFGTGRPWHHYVGWLHNAPVGVASLLLQAGIAGIYGVTTIPEVRRQGVGTAMTLHALRMASALGYRIAVLTPTNMSINIYQRIGFQEYCRIHHYIWSPPNERQAER
jgi:ribosomal protein S18 acetylase RimI-like enzyme